jgi:hypothetical protein
MLTIVLVGDRVLLADSVSGQQIDARVKDVGIYTETPVHDQPFYALKQRVLYPSDRRATIYTEWLLPQPGHYTVRYQIYGPSGIRYVSNSHPFEALKQIWPTWFAFDLPKGEKAKTLAGVWKAEVFLNADRLATLQFELVDQDRHTETDLSIAVFPFFVEDEAGGADQDVAVDLAESLRTPALYVASELQRLFPRVIPPQQSHTLLGEEFALADIEKPGRLFRIRQRLGAEIAIVGRVLIPGAGAAGATLEVAVVHLGTGRVERFRSGLSEGNAVVSPKELMEELTAELLVKSPLLSALRAQIGGSSRPTQNEPLGMAVYPGTSGSALSGISSEPKAIKGIPEIVKEQADAVVFIRVTSKEGERRVGSGVFVRSTGEILTNFHLIEHAKTLTVKRKNEDVYDEVRVLEVDMRRDIALIKVRGWNLPVAKLGDSDLVQVGERVVAIGNPRGLEQTVTDGLISAIRDTGKGYKLFQMSAPISTGSSGGPLFNMAGEAIGIAAAYLEGGQNLNFAIPINYGLALLRDAAPPAKGTSPLSPATPGGVNR